MHKNATKCNKTLKKWCKNKHEASKIIDTFETYQRAASGSGPGAHTMPWRGQGARAMGWCGCPLVPLRLIFGLRLVSGKKGILAFVSSNTENISCVAFLKHKNSKNMELAPWRLISTLVLENA
jgi:hypothetical protein